MRNYTLFTAVGSPASNKVRAYLRWHNVPFRERAATADAVRTLIRPRLKAADVPVLVLPGGEMLRDSRAIIDTIEAREPGESLMPPHAHQRFACRLIEGFGDEWLAPALVSERWFESPETLAMEIGLSVYPDMKRAAANRQARFLSELIRGKLAARGFTALNREATQNWTAAIADALEKHLHHHAFLFGDRPSPADFSLAGALSLDSEALVAGRKGHERPALGHWLSAVNAPSCLPTGQFRRAYDIPPTLIALLRKIAQHFVPEAVASCEAVADWAETHPGRPVLPDVVDRSWQAIGCNAVSKPLRTEMQWLLQRMLEPLHAEEMLQAETQALKTLLAEMECDFLLGYAPARPIVREHNHFRARVVTCLSEPREAGLGRDVSNLLERAERAAGSTRELADLMTG